MKIKADDPTKVGNIHFTNHVLFPVTIAAVAAGFVFLVAILIHGNLDLKTWAKNEVIDTQAILQQLIFMETKTLESTIDSMAINPDLINPFLASDREQLLKNSHSLYLTLKQKYNLSHFYFHELNQNNFLRVHHPPRYGDKIDRYTMKTAALSKQVSTGLELGVLGTYTLRVVKPWVHNNNIIGYLELGLEIDHLFEELYKLTETDMAIMLSKNHLDRKLWIHSNEFLDNQRAWEKFPDYVLASRYGEIADRWLQKAEVFHSASLFSVRDNYLIKSFPLVDAYQQNIGKMILKVDVKDIQKETITITLMGVFIISSGMLVVLFIMMRFTKKVEDQLNDEVIAKEFYIKRSKRDGLTKLFNQKEFYSILDIELSRAIENEAQLSLIMMDIDHFKLINDKHGHRVGDCVLKSLANLTSGLIRDSDYLSRYGGEEFTIILTETSKDKAYEIAERFRRIISEHSIKCNSEPLRITTSLGIACFPEDAKTRDSLVEASDVAMYQAKGKGRNRVESYTSTMRKN